VRGRSYLLSLLFFILALMSKPMAVSLPFVLLILDWYPFNRIQSMKSLRPVFAEKLPFFALSIASSVLTVLAQKAGGSMELMEFVPLSTKFIVAAKSLIAYLWKMIAPMNLIPYYPYPKDVSFFSLEYFPAIALAVVITVACIVMAKKQRLWLAAWGYYAMTLVPVLGIVQVGGQSMADRYMYLPCLGPFLLIGLAVGWSSSLGDALKRQRTAAGLFIAVIAITVFLSLSYLTFGQIRIWKNAITLWSYVIEHEPAKDYLAYYNRGIAFDRADQYNQAIEDYSMAIAINPLAYGTYISRGILHAKAGFFEKATADFNKAIDLDNIDADAYFFRGSVHLQIGNRELALSDFRKVCFLGRQDGCDAVQAIISNERERKVPADEKTGP
jgi:Tfp pilus assembly protein PilF